MLVFKHDKQNQIFFISNTSSFTVFFETRYIYAFLSVKMFVRYGKNPTIE